MNYERETLMKLKMRLTHTSNKDVALIPNNRVPVEGRKRIHYMDENSKPNKVIKQYDNY